MEVEVDDIEPETVDPALEPESGDVEKRVLDFGVVQVGIRLRCQEIVQVVLRASRVPLSGRTAEDREPVVRRRPVGLRVCPDIPVATRSRVALLALGKPEMVAGSNGISLFFIGE